jgi:hypothetical protein
MSNVVDLRSDTVTRPTAGMQAAMAAAPLGDDVFGDDPSVNALQEKIAAVLGFEAALFVPTGTQSNLCAILSHCQRGDEYIVGQMQHCYRWEAGGGAVFGSVQPQPIEHQADGTLALADIEAAIKPDDPHFARSRILALANCCRSPISSRRRSWPNARASRVISMARGFSMPPWHKRPKPAATHAPKPGESRRTSTPSPCASAKALAPRSAPRCAARAS